MADFQAIAARLIALAAPLADGAAIAADTPLIGAASPFRSRQLVELLVAVEEYCEEELGVAFDWTSESAMSETRGIYRSFDALAQHLAGLAGGAA